MRLDANEDAARCVAGAGLRAGDHLCQLFDRVEDQVEVLRAFALDALDANQELVLVASPGLADALAAAVAAGPPSLWERPPLAERLVVVDPESLLRADGTLDLELLTRRVQEAASGAQARGRAGVRLAVDMQWAVSRGSAVDILERYENTAERLLGGASCAESLEDGGGSAGVVETLLCQFDVTRLPATAILEMVDRHSLVATGSSVVTAGSATGEADHLLADVRQRAVGELLARADIYRALFEHTERAVAVFRAVDEGRDFVLVDCNPATEHLNGFVRREVIGRSVFSIYPRRVADEMAEALRRVWLSRQPERSEAVWPGKDAVHLWLDRRVFALPGGEIMTVCDDITDRVQREEELRQAVGHLDALIRTSPVPVLGIDVEQRVIVWNPAAERVFGWKEEEVLGRPIPWVPPGHEEESERNRQAQLAGLSFQGEEFTRLRKDGTLVEVALYTAPLVDAEGRITGFTGVAMDVTERKRAARALRESEERYRRLVELAQEGIWLVDAEGRTMLVNPYMAATLGYEPDEMVGRPVLEFVFPDDVPVARRGFERRKLGLGEVREVRYVRKDGSVVETVMSAVPFFSDDGAFSGAMAVVADLSVRRELEHERLRAAKLESLGTLAGGVAHDFNNLLTGIMGNISFARETEDPVERNEILAAAEEAATRAVGLTKQLLTFAKGGAPVKQAGSVRPLLQQSVSFVLAGSRVRAAFDLQETAAAEFDPGQIGQVIQNLTLNAKEAMPEGGVLTVSTRDHVDDDGRPFVEMVFHDQGGGIAPEIMDKLFDPYFTTKEAGTGLGLAVVHSVVTRHGGYLAVESAPGRGSTFRVFLPAVPEAGVAEGGARRVAAGEDGLHGQVLIVDDESAVRMLLQRALSTMGLEVVACEDGASALAAYEDALLTGRRFDLVITDLTMPGGMGGEELVRRILGIDAEARIVVSSGYSQEAIMADYRAHGVAGALEKPYTVRALRELVGRLLTDR